jgi:hypothetical protein
MWILWQTDRNVDWDICGSYYLAGGTVEDSDNRRTAALNAVPNPFRDRTTISIEHEPPSGGSGVSVTGFQKKGIVLMIYDVSGRCVNSFSRPSVPSSGRESSPLIGGTLCWYGADRNGRTLPPGIYFARLRTTDGFITRKLVKIR